MDDLISRESAFEKLSYTCPGPGECGSKERYRYLQWIADRNAIRETPSAQPKRGKWMDDGKEKNEGFCATCSACGAWSEYLTDYCGNCGAYMRSEEDG